MRITTQPEGIFEQLANGVTRSKRNGELRLDVDGIRYCINPAFENWAGGFCRHMRFRISADLQGPMQENGEQESLVRAKYAQLLAKQKTLSDEIKAETGEKRPPGLSKFRVFEPKYYEHGELRQYMCHTDNEYAPNSHHDASKFTRGELIQRMCDAARGVFPDALIDAAKTAIDERSHAAAAARGAVR